MSDVRKHREEVQKTKVKIQYFKEFLHHLGIVLMIFGWVTFIIYLLKLFKNEKDHVLIMGDQYSHEVRIPQMFMLTNRLLN